MSTKAKVISIISAVLVLALAGWFFFSFYFVHKEGTEYGNLNYFERKGVIFKTYEGKIITDGFKKVSEGVQSNELKFSVNDEALADSLLNCTGRRVRLHYKGYLNPIVWRGESKYIVDEIVTVEK